MKSIIRLLTALLLPPEAAGDYVKFIKLQLTELSVSSIVGQKNR